MAKKVRAEKVCFYNGSRRRPGAEFEVPDDYVLPDGMVPADLPLAPTPAAQKEPQTLSEMSGGVKPVAPPPSDAEVAKRGTLKLPKNEQPIA